MMKTSVWLCIAVTALIMPCQMQAQSTGKRAGRDSVTVINKVVDAITREPVFDVHVAFISLPDSCVVDTFTTSRGDSDNKPTSFVWHTLRKPGEYVVRLSREGYLTTDNAMSIPRFYRHEENIDLMRQGKPFVIRKAPRQREVTLDEVAVVASKVKFFLHGDTMVYNADAFELAEGSMLDALIRRLPGVELKQGGEITVNGRRADELLLNGKDFFDSDRQLMLQNLPTYMVKTVKVYERDDVLGRLMEGKDDHGQKPLIMNVGLKREYSIGWMGNVDAGAGNRYLARLFALRFTPNSRLSAFANDNNVGSVRDPGNEGDWSPLAQGTGVTTTHAGGIDYNVDEKDNRWRTKGNIRASYTDSEAATKTNTQNFLAGGDTYGRSHSITTPNNLSLSTGHSLFWSRPMGVFRFFQLEPKLSVKRQRQRSELSSIAALTPIAEDLESQLLPDSLLLNSLSQRAKNRNNSIAHSLEGGTWMMWPHFNLVGLHLTAGYNYERKTAETFDHYRLQYAENAHEADDLRNRYDDRYDRNLSYHAGASLQMGNQGGVHFLGPRQRYQLNYRFSHSSRDTNRSLYLLPKYENEEHALGWLPSDADLLQALDLNNSSAATLTTRSHVAELRIETHWERGTIHKQLNIELPVRFDRDQLNYQRGRIDTLFHRDVSAFEPTIHFFVHPGRNWQLWRLTTRYTLRTSAPTMVWLIPLADGSNPLSVFTGNPRLRNRHTHQWGVHFNRSLNRGRLYNVNLLVNASQGSTVLGYVYDRATGIRHTTPQNVNGNWDGHLYGGFTLPIDSARRWTLSVNPSLAYYKNVDLIGEQSGVDAPASSLAYTPESSGLRRSVVHSLHAIGTLKLDWRPSPKLSLTGKADAHYLRFEGISACDLDYGLLGQVELPLNVQFSTDLTMYSRRGYADRTMNTDELVWNARVAKRLLNGKLSILLDCFDVLGRLSSVRRTVTAQGRTETWTNVMPRYALLHVVWRMR